MSEFLSNHSESNPETSVDSEQAAQLAINGLSRFVDNTGDHYDGDDEEYDEGYNEEDEDYDDDDYDDDNDYDDYDYDSYYHEGNERIDYDEKNLKLIEMPLPKSIIERYGFIKELPEGVAVMGGVARSIAREMITGEREPIRDIDLINIVGDNGENRIDYETNEKLSREFMPDDYSFGHGIGEERLDNYFKTRDFTINQCLVMDNKLIVSDFAYNDFQENIVRPTYYVHSYDGDAVSGRTCLKALMMQTVISEISSSIPLIEDMIMPEYVGRFNTALFLNKAMGRGAETAQAFVEKLVEWGVVDEAYEGRPLALAGTLARETDFSFRPSIDKRFVDLKNCKDMDGYFLPRSMTSFYSPNPIVKQALAEYDGAENSDFDKERISGYYTQSEFESVNRNVYRQ